MEIPTSLTTINRTASYAYWNHQNIGFLIDDVKGYCRLIKRQRRGTLSRDYGASDSRC